MKKYWGMIGLVGVSVVGLIALMNYFPFGGNEDHINSFEDCVEAGYPVMESYPPQCRTAGGKHFTQEL